MNRVLLWHPEGNTAGNPTLHALVERLLDGGTSVTVRAFAPQRGFAERPGLVWQQQSAAWRRIKSFALNRMASCWLGRLCARVDAWSGGRDFDLVIGVDRRGLIEAWLLAGVTSRPLVFFSFEITFESETSPRHKRLEREAGSAVRRWFVQDPLRGDALARENALDRTRQSLLPLAPAGRRRGAPRRRLRDALGIPADRRVAIVIGSVTRWAMSAEIVASVAAWPADWTLIVHERNGMAAEALRSLGVPEPMLGNERVRVSGEAVQSIDALDEVLAGVSVGLALYRPEPGDPYLGMNLQLLGLASGKIATYLAHGVPVVMNEIGAYADLARAHAFGAVVESPQQVAAALASLDVEDAARRARGFFDDRLDFDRHAAGVLRCLEEAAAA